MNKNLLTVTLSMSETRVVEELVFLQHVSQVLLLNLNLLFFFGIDYISKHFYDFYFHFHVNAV